MAWHTCPQWLPIPKEVLSWFPDFLEKSYQQQPPLAPPSFTNNPPTPATSKQRAQERAKQLCKLRRAKELQDVLQELADSGIPLVFTDGSSAVKGKTGRLAGYGIYYEGRASIATHVPNEYRQTDNNAELLAVLRALHIFAVGDIAICTDSQYVILGAAGAA